MKRRSNLNFILGYTDIETVKLDFDNTSFKTVRYWAFRALRWFRLEGFLILKSSKYNYHVVFNRRVSWSENMRIVAWISLLSNNPRLQKWHLMQCIKEGSTLRVSSKGDKPSPKIVFRYGKEDKQIKEFIGFRKLVKSITQKMVKEIFFQNSCVNV